MEHSFFREIFVLSSFFKIFGILLSRAASGLRRQRSSEVGSEGDDGVVRRKTADGTSIQENGGGSDNVAEHRDIDLITGIESLAPKAVQSGGGGARSEGTDWKLVRR